MKYVCKTKICTFTIKEQNGRAYLYAEDKKLGSYKNANMAADDVYMCATGFSRWDMQLSVDYPSSLDDWENTKT